MRSMKTKTIQKIVLGVATILIVAYLNDDLVTIGKGENDELVDPSVQNKSQVDLPMEGTTEDARVKFIVDGDTLVLEDGRKVRLLGIDTPEVGEVYYDEATDRLRELVDGRDVILKRDISNTDKYGRILRHIYLEDVWINAQMIEEGYAKMVTYPPDVFHIDAFRQLQRDAIANSRGLWDDE